MSDPADSTVQSTPVIRAPRDLYIPPVWQLLVTSRENKCIQYSGGRGGGYQLIIRVLW